jgi:MraZ protein
MVCCGAKWGGVGLLPSLVFRSCLRGYEQAYSSTAVPHVEGEPDDMAFRGTYEHTVDDRGRVAIPARYRYEFADGIVLTLSPEGCLEVYTPDGFDEMSNLVTAEPATHLKGRRLRRGFFARSWDAELDRQGRILIPAQLRDTALLNGSVIINGRRECLEVWNRDRWDEELEQVQAAYAAELESLD